MTPLAGPAGPEHLAVTMNTQAALDPAPAGLGGPLGALEGE
jgi:hypothetical protein